MNESFSADFGMMPTYMGCVSTPFGHDAFHPMRWIVDSDGLLKVDSPPPLELVYPEQHNEPGVSSLWLKHHRAFRDFILSRTSAREMLEIGGADGTLAALMTEVTSRFTNWTIIEPNPHVDPAIDVQVIKGWFPQDLPGPIDGATCIAASHVLEHALDPYVFLADCSRSLPPGGELFLTWPDMAAMASRTDLNMLNFEHLHYLPHPTVSRLLEAAGFVEQESHRFRGHSIFIHAEKVGDPQSAPQINENGTEDLQGLAEGYQDALRRSVQIFQAEVDGWVGRRWLFGAHIFGQFLLAGGLEARDFDGILDNATTKSGKRLYGTELSVSSPECLRNTSENLIIIAAALYEEEILDQLRNLRLSNSRVVTSLHGVHDF